MPHKTLGLMKLTDGGQEMTTLSRHNVTRPADSVWRRPRRLRNIRIQPVLPNVNPDGDFISVIRQSDALSQFFLFIYIQCGRNQLIVDADIAEIGQVMTSSHRDPRINFLLEIARESAARTFTAVRLLALHVRYLGRVGRIRRT
ncbi:hypothetical protein J6590_011744 [Homalodisca vitripennis]|nr:hypothetical protein J6590_011744 [Homalodisca vitripennis]